jgi:hypothetical protein
MESFQNLMLYSDLKATEWHLFLALGARVKKIREIHSS